MTTASVAASPVQEDWRPDALFAPGAPRRRPGALAASAAFGWRAMLKIKHEPKQLVDVTAVPAFLTVLFTYLFGGALADHPATTSRSLCPGPWSWASPSSPCTGAPDLPTT